MIIISPRKETTLPFGKHGNLESKATSEKRQTKKNRRGMLGPIPASTKRSIMDSCETVQKRPPRGRHRIFNYTILECPR